MQLRTTLTRTTPAERRWLVVIALATFVPFVLLAIWAHYLPPTAVEQHIVDALAVGPDLWGDVVTSVNTIGNPVNWIAVVVVLAVAVGLLRGMRAGVFVGATYLVDFVATLAKTYAQRVRPDTAAAHALFGTDSFGFPSGHTARAAALLGALVWVFVPARWRLPLATVSAVIGGLVMGYARVAYGVHFPTDVLGGLLLGVAWFAATALLV
jgi:undecaprenyl-diphosphatase